MSEASISLQYAANMTATNDGIYIRSQYDIHVRSRTTQMTCKTTHGIRVINDICYASIEVIPPCKQYRYL